jgi:HPr Serine kinase C-terminal domain
VFDLGSVPDDGATPAIYAGPHGALRFAVDRDGQRLWADWSDETRLRSLDDVAAILLGPVLGGLLRLRGGMSLHGCVVKIGSEAVALLGNAGVGKSTLAATLAQRGHAVLSDDVVALEERGRERWFAEPGYPRLRVEPETLARLGRAVPDGGAVFSIARERYIELSTAAGAGPWRFQPEATRLAAIYVLDRGPGDGRPKVEEVAGADRLFELLRHSRDTFFPLPVSLREAELRGLGRLAADVPIRRLRCLDGLEHAGATCDVLVEAA